MISLAPRGRGCPKYVTQSMEEYEAKIKAKMLDTLKAESGDNGLPTESNAHAITDSFKAVTVA